MAWHYRAALHGFLVALAFIIIHFISLPGLFPIIRSNPIFPLLPLLLFPVGAYVSIRPMLFREKDGSRKIYILNSMLSALLLAIFLFLFIPLAKDVYTCQILEIPNCD